MIFEISVKASDGIQTERDEKLSKYKLVPMGHDFAGADELSVTNVSDLVLFHEIGRLDYKNFRASLAFYTAALGFSNLALEHQKIASANFCVATSDRDSVHSIEEQIVNGEIFHTLSSACRKARLSRAESEIFNRLSVAEMAQVVDDVNGAENIHFKYERMGREGLISGEAQEGLFDYLDATSGSKYASGGSGPLGLRAKGWTPRGMSLTALSDRILAILNGSL